MKQRRKMAGRLAAEFLVIFAGITLSLLADDWRVRRAEAADERRVLQMLQEDLVGDTLEFARMVGPMAGHEASASWLLSHWDDPTTSPDSVALRLRQFLYSNTYQFRKAAYMGLTEANRLGLIRDDALRSSLIRYYEEDLLVIDQWYARQDLHTVALFEDMGRHYQVPRPRDPGTAWPVEGRGRLVSTWEQVSRDTDLHNQLLLLGAVARVMQVYVESAAQANARLREEVAAALAR